MMAHFLIYIKRGQAKGKSVFVTDDGVICKVISIDKGQADDSRRGRGEW